MNIPSIAPPLLADSRASLVQGMYLHSIKPATLRKVSTKVVGNGKTSVGLKKLYLYVQVRALAI